jgi:hypothetical protein
MIIVTNTIYLLVVKENNNQILLDIMPLKIYLTKLSKIDCFASLDFIFQL